MTTGRDFFRHELTTGAVASTGTLTICSTVSPEAAGRIVARIVASMVVASMSSVSNGCP
jgi:hypothetical protein